MLHYHAQFAVKLLSCCVYLLHFLTLPTQCNSQSFIKTKMNLNFYFLTALWCLKKLREGIEGLNKAF